MDIDGGNNSLHPTATRCVVRGKQRGRGKIKGSGVLFCNRALGKLARPSGFLDP